MNYVVFVFLSKYLIVPHLPFSYNDGDDTMAAWWDEVTQALCWGTGLP